MIWCFNGSGVKWSYCHNPKIDHIPKTACPTVVFYAAYTTTPNCHINHRLLINY